MSEIGNCGWHTESERYSIIEIIGDNEEATFIADTFNMIVLLTLLIV